MAQNEISVHRESSSSCTTGDFDAVDDEKNSASFCKNGEKGLVGDPVAADGKKKQAIASKLHTYQTAHKPSMGQINTIVVETTTAGGCSAADTRRKTG